MTKLSVTVLGVGSIFCTAVLLVCLSLVLNEWNQADCIALSQAVNKLCLLSQRVLCACVFFAAAADILLHNKKAR